jgi:hypothetical protein
LISTKMLACDIANYGKQLRLKWTVRLIRMSRFVHCDHYLLANILYFAAVRQPVLHRAEYESTDIFE